MISSFYESDRALSEYLLFHYGTRDQVLSFPFGPSDALDFPVRCVRECLDPKRLPSNAVALDLGCAVGRSTFELARLCERVVGIDCSRRFVEAAERLRREGALSYQYLEEGTLAKAAVGSVPKEIDRRRVHFEVGDAQNLRPGLGEFDVILMANLIDRLSDPEACLRGLCRLVRLAGQLIITSPYTWLTDYTPREKWLGGYEKDGVAVTTLQALRGILEPDFSLAFRRDLPFLIREHARKFQWSIAEATLWIRV
ncbi:MAG: putative 4-mercaptohistidine N1-methyltransferase [Verrucomicrobia bacterium]|nr:putative 4-mercaptohistidine N1-methyltransferase [Verrucomicrobiota bacterium]